MFWGTSTLQRVRLAEMSFVRIGIHIINRAHIVNAVSLNVDDEFSVFIVLNTDTIIIHPSKRENSLNLKFESKERRDNFFNALEQELIGNQTSLIKQFNRTV